MGEREEGGEGGGESVKEREGGCEGERVEGE